jgi:hypothetical protein
LQRRGAIEQLATVNWRDIAFCDVRLNNSVAAFGSTGWSGIVRVSSALML